MSRVSVRPKDSCLLNGLVAGDGPAGRLFSQLAVKQIDVDEDNGIWTVALDLVNEALWADAAGSVSWEEFDVMLAAAGQEIRKKVEGLEQVRWTAPENLDGTFGRLKPDVQIAERDGRHRGRARIARSEAIPMSRLTGGEKQPVTVWGEIVEARWRRNVAGKLDGVLIVTDRSDSVRVRIPSAPVKMERLEPGTFILARGRATIDRFDAEPTLVASAGQITVCPSDSRDDLAPQKRVELHLHTKMSQMDSVLDLEKAIRRVGEWGHRAVAITDHGVAQAFPAAGRLGRKYGVKIIYGLEAYLVDDPDDKGSPWHLVLLAKSRAGLRSLYDLVTESHLKYFYRTPRIPRALLAAKRDGLYVGSGCEAGEVFRAVLNGETGDALRRVASFYDYLEIQPLDNNQFLVDLGQVPDRDVLATLNRTIYDLAVEMGKPCVMTGDVHYLDPEDEIYRRILLTGKGMGEGERTAAVYFRTTTELLLEAAHYLGEEGARRAVVDDPSAIASSVEDMDPVPHGSFFPSLPDADATLKTLAEEGAKRIYGPVLPPVVRERLDRELGAIVGHGFASLYVIAIRMVEKSLKDGYWVGSRGSIGSSLVATCTGVTEVNPLPPHYVCPGCHWADFSPEGNRGSGFDLARKSCPRCGRELHRDGQDIPFETFMGFHGEKVPDIDLNFSGEEQGEMFRFASSLLGEGNVFRAGTIATIARKTAYGFVKHYAEDLGKTLRRAEETRLSIGIEGVKRTTGQHPGGVMVIPSGYDVLDFTPLQYPADDRQSGAITTHFDYDSLSGHLVKIDILGHDDPTVLKMLHELTGVDPLTVPMDDPETLKLFSGENPDDAVGVPEFGTRFVRSMLAETRPASFADLVRISGLSHGTDVWANNARDLIRTGTATLDQVIATREDILLGLTKLGVDPAEAFSIAEKVRKGKALSGDDVATMKALSVPDWYIDSCRKITYLFPKAHAAAYVTTAFRIAYFKVHYPLAFAAAYFSFHGSSLTTDIMFLRADEWRSFIDRLASQQSPSTKDQDVAVVLEVALEMARRGVSFARPSLYLSQATRYVPHEGGLIPPFIAIPGVGAQAAQAMVSARAGGTFTSVEDFRRRTRLGKRVCDSLRDQGIFDGLPEGEQLPLF